MRKQLNVLLLAFGENNGREFETLLKRVNGIVDGNRGEIAGEISF